MFLKSIRWLLGYTSFKLYGGCSEKFINLTRKNKINIWNLKTEIGCLTGEVIACEYNQLKNLAKYSGSVICIKYQKGLPFNIVKYKNRWGILAGVFLFLFILFMFSTYIWSIKVFGNETIPEEEILSVFEELGVSCGSLKNKIDFPIIEQIAMTKLDKISWLSVNLSGSCVNILIKEKLTKPEFTINDNEPCNIISSKDGQIIRFETYQGEPAIQIGDTVTKGQLLISGICENQNLESHFVNADAKVLAKTTNKITKEIPINCTEEKNTGKVIEKNRIKFFGLELPSFNFWSNIDDSFQPEFSCKTLNFLGKDIPIKIYKEIWREKVFNSRKLTPDEAINKARDLAINDEKSNLKNTKILSESVEISEEKENYKISFTFSCIENISKKEKIFFE